MFGFGVAKCLKFFAPGVLVGEVALGEFAILNFSENLLHRFAALSVDHARAAYVVAPLGRVGDGVAHVGKAATIDKIHDQLQFVKHFEVGALRLIAGFDEGFIASLDERADAAAEHGLFAEEIGLGLFFKRGL